MVFSEEHSFGANGSGESVKQTELGFITEFRCYLWCKVTWADCMDNYDQNLSYFNPVADTLLIYKISWTLEGSSKPRKNHN